jgi:hypothetical protein
MAEDTLRIVVVGAGLSGHFIADTLKAKELFEKAAEMKI